MAEALISWTISKLDSLITGEVKLLREVQREFEDVRDELDTIKSFLKDATRLSLENEDDLFKVWVKQVTEIAFRIEDAIDEYILCVAQNRDQHGFLRIIRLVKNLNSRHNLASKILNIKKAVCEVRERSDRYSFNSAPGRETSESYNAWHDPRVASLFVEETELVGVEAPKNELVSRLVERTSKSMVISIVGMGGSGKTTLAKKVYDSQRVASYFDCQAWITVSQSYNRMSLLRNMIEQFQQGTMQPAFDGIDTMDEVVLIGKLREYLAEKRYVIVFDDVWRTDFWISVKNALPDNGKGGRIMITTRNEGVAPSRNESSSYHVYKLQHLPHDKAFELFCKKIFRENQYCPPELLDLSHTIVEKCDGLPLAIVAASSLLATKDRTILDWTRFLNSLSSSLASDQCLSGITKILSLSVHDLPYYLKPCLLYFSLFPEDYSISCWRLIRLWIAEGFIKERRGMTVEEVAEEYLMELIRRSLVQVARISFDGKVRNCRVHDLMREIILSQSKELSFHQVSMEHYERLKGRGRHLSICDSTMNIPEPNRDSQTHSVIFFDLNELPKSLISSFLANLKLLRTLDLEGAPLDHLPAEVWNLWHLRYLSLRKTKVKKLAKSIGRLCNLETLDLRQTPVYDLPVEINRLLKLRHLLAFFININDEPDPNFQRGVKMNGSIGSLKLLQKLSFIEVDHDTGLIQQVEKLTQLRKLGIKKLKRESGIELCSALEKMPHLCTLRISSLNKEEFLDLQALSYPPPLLQRLSLSGPLVELPHWITKLRSLVRIQLNWSRLRDDALQILQDLPNLQELGFYEGYNGDELHFKNGYFEKLKVLYLRCLTGLNKLIIDEGALPLLEKLSIGPFPKFNKIPSGIHFLRNLKRLKLFDIQTQIVLGILPDNGHDYWKVEHIAIVNLYYKIKGERYRSYKLGDSDLFKRLESIEE